MAILPALALLAASLLFASRPTDDALAAGNTFSLSASTYSGTEGTGIVIGVLRTAGATQGTVHLDFSPTSSPVPPATAAVPDVDYSDPGNGSGVNLIMVAGQPGSTPQNQYTLSTIQNGALDGPRQVTVTLTSLTGDSITTASAIVTIQDDDGGAVVQFASTGATFPEGTTGLGIEITRAGGTAGSVSVTCTISLGTAQAGDYTATSPQIITFGPGQTSKTCNITSLINDGSNEGSETLILTLSNVSAGSSIGANNPYTLTIIDGSGGTFQFSSSTFTVLESNGPADLVVVRSGGSTGTVVLQCTRTGGTASEFSDWTTASVTVSFGPGETSDSCEFPIVNDAIAEPPETVTFALSIVSGTGSLGGQTSTTLTITDDDGVGTFFLSSSTYSGTEGAANNVVVTVNRSPATGTATVNYATSNGTATAGLDYTAVSGTLTFVDGDATETVTIPIINDILLEGPETFIFTLSNPSTGATLGTPSAATITINDNDGGVTVTSLSPAAGPPAGGNNVTINGTGFEFSCSVTFGGITATRATGGFISSNQMIYIAPSHAIGVVDVIVTCGLVSSPNTVADNYTYTGGPTITSLTPTSGPGTGNTIVSIAGSNFANVQAVKFGSVDAIDYTVNSSTLITAVAPPGAAGTVDVSVTTTAGISPNTSADDYTYTSSGSIPVITSLSPSSTPVNTSGTTVTISGSNLLGATSVTFGGTSATIQSVTSTQIVVTAPSRSTAGTVEVVVTVPSVGSNTTAGTQNDFTYSAVSTTQTVTLYVRWSLFAWQGPTMNALAALQGNDSNPATNDVSGVVTAIYWWNAAGTGCPTGQTQCWFAFFPDGVNIPGANDFTQLVHNEAYWFANGTSASVQWTYPKQ